MRRPSGFLVACVMMVLPLCPPALAQAPAGAQPAPAAQPAAAAKNKVTFDNEVVLWAFTVKPDKTGDYEKVLDKLKAALQKISRPEAKQQLAGWKVVRNSVAQPDGTILYVHVLNPVVKGADYSIINLVYEAFTDYAEQKAFYDLYSGSVNAPLFAIQGPTVDLGK
jgi:hypothetical protein